MTETLLLNVTLVDRIITQGDCPLCGECFVHGGILGETTKDEVTDKFDRHLMEKHPGN